MKKILVLTALFLAAAGASAQQYKWVDRNGRVQYGDVPPAGAQATPLRGAPRPAAAAPAASKGALTAAEMEAAFRKRQEEAGKEREKQAQAAQETQERKENCMRAREHLRNLESGQRITRTNASGERQFLDDAQIAQEAVKARQSVQEWCS